MDQMLQKVIDGTAKNVKNKDAFERITVAGLKMMFSKETHQMLLEGMDQAQDIATWAGEGIAGVLGMLAKNSKGTMPFEPMIASGVVLLMHALDFLSQLGKVELSNETIDTATKAYALALMKAAGIDENKLLQMGQQASAAVQDPQKAELLKQTMGAQNGNS